jgi:hypothetical protein
MCLLQVAVFLNKLWWQEALCENVRKNRNTRTVGKNVILAPYKTEHVPKYVGWNFNSGNYLFTTDTK